MVPSGLSPGAVMEAGRSVSLQEGALSTLEKAAGSGVPVHVVSVSWEGNIIRYVSHLMHNASRRYFFLFAKPLDHLVLDAAAILCSSTSHCVTLVVTLVPRRGALGMPEEAVKVHANSLQLNEDAGASTDNGCTGGTTQEIQCAEDKRSVLAKLLQGSATKADEGISVFIGDSATDLLALLQAGY